MENLNTTSWILERNNFDIHEITIELSEKISSFLSLPNIEGKDLLLPTVITLLWVWFVGFFIYVLKRAKEEWGILEALEKINSEYPKN